MHIKELLDEHGIPYREGGESKHVTEGFLGIDCPYCSPSSGKFKLGYSLAHGFLSCWTCGYQRLPAVLSEITGKPEREFYPFVQHFQPTTAPREKVQGKLQLPFGVGSLLPVHKNYLRQRGFSAKELSRLWGLMGIGLAGHLAWRLFIPIHHKGQMVSWTTRSLCGQGVRYVNARPDQESQRAKELLFGEDYCRHACIVTEGPFDVFRIGPGAVATMGLACTPNQVEKLTRFPVRVVVYDNEPLAQVRAGKLCAQLEAFPGSTYLVQLDADDPGSASRREIQLLRRSFLE